MINQLSAEEKFVIKIYYMENLNGIMYHNNTAWSSKNQNL